MSVATPEKTGIPPQALLVQMTFGFILSQAISVAAKLRLADLLAERPQTAEEIAADNDLHAPSLFRLMRALAKAGVLKRDEENRFSNTEISEFLRTDHPESLRAILHMICDREHWMAQGNLEHAVRTGECAFEHTFGMPAFPYLAEHPKEARIFDEAMTSLSTGVGNAVAATYDFSGAETIADIGGGHGILISSVLKAYPDAKGILFDQEQVVEGADLPAREGVADRTEIVAGDFFADVPVEADIYLMKHIIHDWSDEQSVTILSNIAGSAKPGAKLLLIETLVEEKDVPSLSGLMDLNMLAMTTGKERTVSEYAGLMERSGWRFKAVYPTPSPMQIVEAVLAG